MGTKQSACEDSAAFEDHVDAGAADLDAGAERRDDHLGIWAFFSSPKN